MTSTTNRAVPRSLVALALAVLLSACGGTADSDTGTAPSSTRDAEPNGRTTTSAREMETVTAPDAVGPYAVGRRTIALEDATRGRKLDVDVWYPATPGSTGTPSRYSFLPTVFFDSKVALDAPPVAVGRAFPLVVYSHGSGGLRYVASYFTEVLASHGFVVVSADHTGDTATDRIVGSAATRDQNAVNRVGDARFLIDSMLAKNSDPADPFHDRINADEVGITGHSFGGFTAIATATGFANPLGSFPPDPRIKAVAVMAPYTKILDDATLKKLDVPTMLVTGTKDITTPIEPMTERPFELAAARPIYRVDLVDGAHQSFSDVCFYQDELPKIVGAPQILIDTVDEQALEGCGDGFLAIDRAQQIANTFIVSFLETRLARVSGYDTVLTPEGAAGFTEAKFSVTTG